MFTMLYLSEEDAQAMPIYVTSDDSHVFITLGKHKVTLPSSKLGELVFHLKTELNSIELEEQS